MPVIKSAKKKLRQDKKRRAKNAAASEDLKTAIKKAKKTSSEASVRKAIKLADKAAKSKIIHKNKAARIKSSLSKLIKGAAAKGSPVKAGKPKSTKKLPARKPSKTE